MKPSAFGKIYSHNPFYLLARAFVLAGLFVCTLNALARPRDALPPMPELAPILFHENFDYVCPDCVTNARVTIPNYGELVASWSWYALQRSGTVTPFIISAVDSAGRPVVACDTGALRFWLKPYWSSAPDGTGPGKNARLVELVVAGGKQVATVWWLQVSPDGSALSLIGQTDTGPVELLKAGIDWQAGESHLVTLDYGPKGTALFIDGQLAAEGEGTLAVPPKVAALVWGSTLAGTETADGEMDELYCFGLPLTAADVAFYYHGLSRQAARGPISAAEEQAEAEAAAKWLAELESAGSPPMGMLAGATSECFTNVPVYLTNIVTTFDSNQGRTVTFDIQGSYDGTTTALYDVFTTTNLVGDNGALSQWTWLESGPTCSTYQYTNQPEAQAFYILGTPIDLDGDGLPSAFELLVSRTNPQLRDSDNDGRDDGDELDPEGIPWRLARVRHSQVVVYATSPVATEGGSCGQFTVRLPAPAPVGGAVVQYRLGGSAVLNTEYTLSPTAFSVTVPAGSTLRQISVCAVNDALDSEMDRQVELTLTNAPGYVANGATAVIELADNDPPAVRVLALPPWIREPSATYGTNTAAFFFIRDGSAANALTVTFSRTGTATSAADFDALSGTITFPAGERTLSLPLNLRADTVDEGDETVQVTLTSAPGYQLDPANGTATVVIAANGLPALSQVQVSATDDDAREAGLNPGQFTFTRSSSVGSLRVYYRVAGTAVTGSPNSERDYVALPGYVDFAAGTTSVPIPVTPIDDNLSETVETVVVVLAAGDYKVGANNLATVYIDDNETTAFFGEIIRHGVYGASVSRASEIRVTRYGTALATANVDWRMTYGYIGNTLNLVVPSGDASGTRITWAARQSVATAQFATLWSSYSESQVAPTLSLSNSIGQQFLNVTYHPPSQLVSVASAASPAVVVPEGATVNGALIFRRLYPNANPFTLHYEVLGSAVYGTEYTVNTPFFGQVSFGPNVSQVTVPVQALANSQTNGWRTAVVRLSPGAATIQVPEAGQDLAYVRLQDAQVNNPVADTDMDFDGLTDGFELANPASGLDPLKLDNPYVDPDRDGLGLFEEVQLGTNPNVADAQPTYPSEEAGDYVPLIMRVGAAGKLATQMSCAVCHEVGLRAGAQTRTSPRTSWEATAVSTDHVIRFLRGTNYPVRLLSNPYSRVLPVAQTNATAQQYTATYTAQFLSSNTVVYPFVSDANLLLGTNRPLVSEALNQTATLYVPDLIIAADVDRDGAVNFANRTDRTSTNNPLVFWINDDNDVGNDDTAADEEVTSSALMDSTSTSIDSLRDLEDFARLQFRIDGLPGSFVTNAGWQTRIYLTNLAGTPSLRLFPAAEASGGIGYLTNTTTATAQMGKTGHGVLSSGTSLTLNHTNWQANATNRFTLPMIFEGVSTGRCVIVFGLASNAGPVQATSRPFYLDLKPVTRLYEHWTVGDNITNKWDQIPNRATRTADSAVFGVPPTTHEKDYILFVHGWRMKPWERRAFAGTGFKRLWQTGYKGRFGLYSWPTEWVDDPLWLKLIDPQNYDRSERRAFNSAFGLQRLLVELNRNHPDRVRLMAHSMGNVVASEALRLKGLNPARPPVLHTYVASQAATVAHAYDAVNPETVESDFTTDTPEVYAHYPVTGLPYFNKMTNAVVFNPDTQRRRVVNYNNRDDYALDKWLLNQDTKPDVGWEYIQDTGRWSRTLANAEPLITLQFPQNTYEIYSHIAEARSRALGAAERGGFIVRGQIGDQINLNGVPFSYGANDYEHSAQFRSTNMRRNSYWSQLLSTFGITQ
jgi:hypothetical protein